MRCAAQLFFEVLGSALMIAGIGDVLIFIVGETVEHFTMEHTRESGR